MIKQELWFFAGVSIGGLVSVILFLTCFQRKQYLLILWLNSLYILWNSSMIVFTYLDENYEKESPFIHLIHDSSVMKSFSWGLVEQATGFVLIYILPTLLAIKFRTSKDPSTMGGTVIGVVATFTYLVATICYGIFKSLGVKQAGGGKPDEDEMNSIVIRGYRVILVLISNIFFIEWAFDDYQLIKKRNRQVTWCQLLSRVFCCLQT